MEIVKKDKLVFYGRRHNHNGELYCHDFNNIAELLKSASGRIVRFWWYENTVKFPLGQHFKGTYPTTSMVEVSSDVWQGRSEINVGYPAYNINLYIPCDRKPNPTEDYLEYIDNVLFKSHVIALLEAQKLWERWQNYRGSDRDFIKQIEQETWGDSPLFDLSLPELMEQVTN